MAADVILMTGIRRDGVGRRCRCKTSYVDILCLMSRRDGSRRWETLASCHFVHRSRAGGRSGWVGSRPRTAANPRPFVWGRCSKSAAVCITFKGEHREEGRGGGLGGDLGPMVPTHRRRKGPSPGRFSAILWLVGWANAADWCFVQYRAEGAFGWAYERRKSSISCGKSRENSGPRLARAGKQTRAERRRSVWA